jgi:hypothetical protein
MPGARIARRAGHRDMYSVIVTTKKKDIDRQDWLADVF